MGSAYWEVVVAAAGLASPPLEVAGAPPLEVVVPVVLGVLFLGYPVPATLQIGHGVVQWPQVGRQRSAAVRLPALRP